MAFFHKGFIKTHPLISVILYVLRLYLAFSTVSPAKTAIDSCYNYTVLDNPWRSISNGYSYTCDTSVSWSGWYRLFINGLSAHIPDTCVAQFRCGTNIALWIRGGHPTVSDGVVSRDVCGYWNNYCCFYGSFPIKVKACPGNYYVYELVKPTLCYSAYCADIGSINTSPTAVTPDPCYNYTVLDNPWRSINNTYGLHPSSYTCDQYVSWSGWYRLFINNTSAHIPDTCVAKYSCGTDVPLWIRGGHPTVSDGVVTRDVCGYAGSYCCYYGSFPIKVKACPGNYYVYELVSPTICNSAYCADVSSINTSSTTVTPVIISPASSNTTVYIVYAVGGLVIAVIILVVGLIAVHQCRKKVKTSASTGSVMPVNKQNESRDEQKSDAKDFDESVYENDTPNTDKSTPMKPINRPEVPKRQEHAVYGNVQLSVGQSHELYGNL